MNSIRCFCMGHSDAPETLLPTLIDQVERLARERNVGEYIVGNYGNFDRLAAAAVRKVKESCPSVRLTLLLPYYPAGSEALLPDGFDGSFFPPGMERVPKRLAIVRANEYAMSYCGYVICYNSGKVGNTKKMVEKAMKRQDKGLLHVINLTDC